MSNYLTSMPSQIIRDAVTSILESFNSALSINEIENFISEELEMPHPIHTSEELSYLHTILEDMVSGGRIEIKNKMIYAAVQSKPQYKNYNPDKIETEANNILEKPNSKEIYTIGSQYYVKAWSELEESEVIKVSLIKEANNPYDKNAVAVTFKGYILGHLTRSDAREYSQALSYLADSNFTLTANATVMYRSNKSEYRYLKVDMPSVEDLAI